VLSGAEIPSVTLVPMPLQRRNSVREFRPASEVRRRRSSVPEQ
jgi:hypothetical protein